jgi:hypothetical protein
LDERSTRRKAPTYTQDNTYTYQTSMRCVGFETAIPDSERAKTVRALDRSATVIGDWQELSPPKFKWSSFLFGWFVHFLGAIAKDEYKFDNAL